MAELDGPDVPTAEEIEARTLTYIYDIDDNLTEIQYPETGSKVKGLKFSYNHHQWLTGIRADTGEILDQKVRDYSYGNDGLLLQIKDYKGVLGGSGYVQRDYEYDAFERPVLLEYRDSAEPETIKESYAYTYDKNNNILSEQIRNDYPEKAEDRIQEERVYTYDSLGRLLTSTITDQKTGTQTNSSYQYDEVGNRKKETKNGVVTTYEYNDFNQLITSEKKNGEQIQSKKSYQYDKNGNQIAEEDTVTNESRVLGYDAAGNLARCIGKQGDTIAFTQQNQYNGNGQRIQKSEGDQTTRYYYQGDAVLYTTDGTGALTAQNLLGTADNVIATTRGTEDAEQYYLYNKDIRESTSNVLDSEGTSQISYQYDEFGETDIRGDKEFSNEICYTGSIYDETTGLYYLNARYYDPENANFLSQDTYRGEVSDPESLHLYAYCKNNPISYTDPNGYFFGGVIKIGFKVAGKVGKAAKKVGKKIAKTVKSGYKKVKKKIEKYLAPKPKPKTTKPTKKKARKAQKPSNSKKSSTAKSKKKVTKPKKKVSSAKKKKDRTVCFVAGTKVSTEKGLLAIEKIKPGDKVWAEEPYTGKHSLKKVTRIFSSKTNTLVHIYVNKEKIETTEGHMFWVEGKGWTIAKKLKKGDNVRLLSGGTIKITHIEFVSYRVPIKVFNFEVEDFHTYYISPFKILVHNDCYVTPDSNPENFVKLKNGPGYKDSKGNIWKKDKMHKDHWDVSNKKGKKVREVSYDGKKIWPNGPKNKNK